AIHCHIDAHAAARRVDQRLLQRTPDPVLEDYEGFQHDAMFCRAYRFESRREKGLAIFQQSQRVSRSPIDVHSISSTASGAWSDKCVHGRAASGTGSKSTIFLM